MSSLTRTIRRQVERNQGNIGYKKHRKVYTREQLREERAAAAKDKRKAPKKLGISTKLRNLFRVNKKPSQPAT